MSYLLPDDAPQSRLPGNARCDLAAFPAIQSKRLLLAAILGLSVTSCERAKDARYDLSGLPSQIGMEGAAFSSVDTADAMQHLQEFERDADKLARFQSKQTIIYDIDPQLSQRTQELIAANMKYISNASRRPFARMSSPSENADIRYTLIDDEIDDTAYAEVFNPRHGNESAKCAYSEPGDADGSFGAIAIIADGRPTRATHDKLLNKCIDVATIKTLGLSGEPHTFPSILNEANEGFLIRSFTKFDFAAMRLHFAYGVDPDSRERENEPDDVNE